MLVWKDAHLEVTFSGEDVKSITFFLAVFQFFKQLKKNHLPFCVSVLCILNNVSILSSSGKIQTTKIAHV